MHARRSPRMLPQDEDGSPRSRRHFHPPAWRCMKISVITVCRNSERTIAHTMESFLAQTHADKEMVVVDGASTDRTLEIVRNFGSPAIRVLSEPDNGIY